MILYLYVSFTNHTIFLTFKVNTQFKILSKGSVQKSSNPIILPTFFNLIDDLYIKSSKWFKRKKRD